MVIHIQSTSILIILQLFLLNFSAPKKNTVFENILFNTIYIYIWDFFPWYVTDHFRYDIKKAINVKVGTWRKIIAIYIVCRGSCCIYLWIHTIVPTNSLVLTPQNKRDWGFTLLSRFCTLQCSLSIFTKNGLGLMHCGIVVLLNKCLFWISCR